MAQMIERIAALQDYDQYRLFPREAAMTVGRAWAADTQRRIQAMGLWPENLQKPAQALGQ